MNTDNGENGLLRYLSHAPAIAAIMSLALYIFGFITVFSYHAGFGFSTYEIINTKFIAAGFLAAIAMCAVGIAVFWLYPFIEEDFIPSFFKSSSKSKRLLTYLILFLVPQAAAFILYNFYNYLGGIPFKGRSVFDLFSSRLFGGFGTWDIWGSVLSNYLDKMHWSSKPGYAQIIPNMLYIFVYFCLILLSYRFIAWVRSLIKAHHTKNNQADITISEKKYPTPPTNAKPHKRTSIDTLIDALGMLFIIFFYLSSIQQLLAARTNSENLADQELTYEIVIAWLFSTVIPLFLFLMIKPPTKNLKSIIDDPQITDNLVRYTFIPLMASLILFGQALYPKISYSIGGGRPRKMKIPEEILERLGSVSTTTTFLIDETNEYYLLVMENEDSGKVMQLRKEDVLWAEITR